MVAEVDIDSAVLALRAGQLVAIPTETVYGLAADAGNPAALRRIFHAKGRPQDHPLIVHLADVAQLSAWAREIPPVAVALAEAFWPGPLTLILKKAASVSDLVTGEQDTVGVRIPNHPIALALLRAFGSGVAAPSANRFGRISPTTASAVQEELGATVAMVLDGGQCMVGVESTIVDVSQGKPVILRPGRITAAQIERVLHCAVQAAGQSAPRVSGSLASHYAPETRTELVASNRLNDFLRNTPDDAIAVLCYSDVSVTTKNIAIVRLSAAADEYAHDLYHTLRALDKQHFSRLIIEAVPLSEEWDAVRDRLQRAAVK